ncbi:Thiol-disulfide oxidoreductase ResA [termite gut metagenome]|uniref:Thiol-disulfide oxidoreductase ResA n=2 Tax=termite gut metagenome TaxID=433724 RepID=A0A5J4SNT6_9ZZZZ
MQISLNKIFLITHTIPHFLKKGNTCQVFPFLCLASKKRLMSSFFINRKILTFVQEKKMKNYFFLFFTLISLFGCKHKTEQGKTYITGNITGIGTDTIYLYGVDELSNLIDTIYVKNDKFFHTIQVDTICQMILLFNNGQTYPVFLDKKNRINIKGNIEHLNLLDVNGNPVNEELTSFLQSMESKGTVSETSIEEKVDSFICKNNSSPASIYLLDKYFVRTERPDNKRIKLLIEAMTGELQDKPYIQRLKEIADRVKDMESGQTIPSFTLTNIKGKKISRFSTKSEYLLIHFWASWNTESRLANAALRKINRISINKEKKRKKKGKDTKKELDILGISLDTNKEDWKQAVKQDTLTWEQVCDFYGWSSDVVKQCAVLTLPTNVLIHSTGRIIAYNIKQDSLSLKLEELIK